MMDSYIEILVKRNVENEKKNRKRLILIIILFFIAIAIFTKLTLVCFLLIPVIFGYYFMVSNYHVEFEYFYMDGESTISKIINKSRRKKILELNDGIIKFISPADSSELQRFNNLKKMDCTANEPLDIPYAIVYMHNGELKVVNIQMTDELYKELKRNMPYKVQRN